MFLYLLNIFATAVPKLKQNLAIVNHWNWLDDSPPLKQAMRKSYPPTGLEPAAFGLPVHCSTT